MYPPLFINILVFFSNNNTKLGTRSWVLCNVASCDLLENSKLILTVSTYPNTVQQRPSCVSLPAAGERWSEELSLWRLAGFSSHRSQTENSLFTYCRVGLWWVYGSPLSVTQMNVPGWKLLRQGVLKCAQMHLNAFKSRCTYFKLGRKQIAGAK